MTLTQVVTDMSVLVQQLNRNFFAQSEKHVDVQKCSIQTASVTSVFVLLEWIYQMKQEQLSTNVL